MVVSIAIVSSFKVKAHMCDRLWSSTRIPRAHAASRRQVRAVAVNVDVLR